jgi:mRNA-degrading endonuclease RelE of RelBE toxin-antitoxin system
VYQVELTEAAVDDMEDFSDDEQAQLIVLLSSLADEPKPQGVQVIPMAEAADGLAYLYETDWYRIYYTIYETAQVVRVAAIFRRVSWN